MTTQTHIAAQQKMQFQLSLLENPDAPKITLLGSLGDDQGISVLELEAQSPKPFLAVIYTGI